MENKIYRIYTRWVAFKLRQQGFSIVGTEINENFPQFNVYLFKDSEKLRKSLSQIKKEKPGRS